MNVQQNYGKWGKSILMAFVMTAFLAFTAAPRVHADERSACQHAIEKAEARLDDAIAKRGEHSHEAEERRHELNDERQHCWDKYHEWWNGRDHEWHKDHW